jgi:hypothetical protein
VCKGTREARACLQVGKQDRAKAEREDLEVGAVDELLVGECVVRARDKEEKTLRCFLHLAFLLSTLLLTNNIILFYFILFILSIIS